MSGGGDESRAEEEGALAFKNNLEEDMDCLDEDPSQHVLRAQRFALPATADATVAQWRAKHEAGLLTAATFHDYWRVTVPRLYSPEPNRNCLDWSFDEERATALLLRPLQQFMCGGEPGEVLPRRLQSSSPVCGRVFKSGEPAYSCRECGMDNTCVLCVDCFKVSEHRNHKYKMGQSNGGGCCDCGDPEAWRRHPNCELHPADTEVPEDSKELPADMAERVNLTLSVILGYCYRLLTLEHAPGLPNDLRLKEDEKDPLQILEQPDCYCTVLYNDETHTFEQVITTLTRMIKCTHRDAVEYVTNIDREGRSVVKCSSFQACNELKGEIEKFTSRHGHKSLKVLVMHAHVVAHQIYAMKLLQWLQNFVSGSEQLRKALATAALALAEGVMQRDCQLWKAARTAWQRMLITTMLSDYASKRTLATLFTKNYASILKDYIRDDHDHAYSVSSLSVQLYTTPTLAHHLIAEQDALYNVLNTFYSECSRKCNKQGRLEFERNMSPAFKRAQFILYDVKYLLTAPPAEWTNPLRSGFLHGVTMLLKLLACMQGMDAVSRQVGQHMEFEPEWESAFNLHVKLSHAVSLALQWCASDRVVLAKAYRLALKKLHETETVVPGLVKELGDHSASVIPYDVSAEPVSIHLPLSRFLAGLHLLLHRHGLAFDGPEFNMPKLTPEQIIEPVLRTAAMIAQVHAGMWRRNGYALLNQLFFYHNVKCRPEMLDRDIVLLQVGASLIESNEFVIHTLNKLGLLVWAAPDFEATSLRAPEEDSMRQTISLVEEFLGLLITIIGSRHVPGVGEVTAAERTKKEIIQQLCVRPMAHSELNRALPEDELHETGMEAVIDEIADFNKPTSGQGKGVYTLKSELFDEYDTFFYHYTREELSRSEEEQRKRRKLARLTECCPPPRLPKLAPPFTMVANLVQCDAALHVMRVVLQRALDLRARSFSETQLHKVLHLMGYGLRDEESGHYEFVAFAARASRAGLPALLQQLATSPRVDAHRALILWTVQKFRSVLGENSEEKSNDMKMDTDESATKASTEETEDADKAWRAKMAAQRRAKVMAQMEALQKNFMSNNAQLFEETETGRTVSTSSSEAPAPPTTCGAALSANARTAPVTESPRTCIMCQEDAAAEPPAPPLVLVAFVQQSTVLARHRSGHDTSIPPDDPLWLEAGLRVAPHVSSCGHVMHADCWQKYIDNVILKENRRPYRLRQPASFDVDKQEYLCPLCERLCNTAMPLLPATPPAPPQAYEPLPFHAFVQGLRLALKYKVSSQPMHVCSEQCSELHCRASRSTSALLLGSATDAADAKRDDTGAAPAYYACHARREVAAELGMWGEQFLEVFTGSVPEYNADMADLIQLFSQATYTIGLNANPHTGDPRAPLALWRAAAYTLLSADALLRAERRPLLAQLAERHRHCLQALVRISCSMGPIWPKSSEIGSHALRLAGAALDGSPLQWDALGLLVPLASALPALFAGERLAAPAVAPATVSRHATRLVLMALVTRVLVTADYELLLKDEVMEMEGEVAVEEETVPGCSKLMDMVKLMQRGRVDVERLSLGKIWKQVQEGCRSYLRCCCLFFHFVSGVDPPAGLTQLEGDTWPVMCAYLALPDTFDELFDSETALELAVGWSRHEEVDKFFAGQIEVATVREPRQPPGLVALPADFSELINAVSLFTCPNSEREDSKYPTMCLVCNEMLCSQSYCCQTELNKTLVGACVAHAASCGAGACLFLRVRECETLLLAAPSRGCHMPAPYRDCYGETDQGLRRGNPLQLCRERYEAQRLLWLGHGVYERIARSIETGSLIPTMWQHM